MPDGHTAIAGWDSGEPVSAKTDPTLQSFDSDFIDGAFDDALTGVSPPGCTRAVTWTSTRSLPLPCAVGELAADPLSPLRISLPT